jgi:hypothetical protein
MLFKWFLGLAIDDKAFDATTFSKNRKRLLEHEIADEFFAAVVSEAKLRRYMSSDHFSVDGTLLQAWASHKSFKPDNAPTAGIVVTATGSRAVTPKSIFMGRNGRTKPTRRPRTRRRCCSAGQHRGGAVLYGASVDREPFRADS